MAHRIVIPAGNLRSGCTGAEPYAPWNDREPWEGRRCGECVYAYDVAACTLCLREACVEGFPYAMEVGVNDDACECFADELPRRSR